MTVQPTTLFPLEWEYQVRNDFYQDGLPARWANGDRSSWGAEDHSITTGPISDGALSPDEQHLAVAVQDAIKIYSMADFSLHETLGVPEKKITHLEWHQGQGSQACYLLLASVKDSGEHIHTQVVVWELPKDCHRQDARPDLAIEGTSFGCNSKSFSFSGATLLVFPPKAQNTNSRCVEVWDSASGECRMRLNGHTDHISWAGYSWDDSAIASSSWDQMVRLWDASNGSLLRSLGPVHGQAWAGSFSPNGKLIACGTGHSAASMFVWKVDTGEIVISASPFPAWVRTLAWSTDSVYLAFGAMGGAVRIQNIESGRIEQDWRLSLGGARTGVLAEIKGIQWLSDTKRICFSTGLDAGVEVYDIDQNVKWRFEPNKDDSARLGPGNRSATPALWHKKRNMLLCMDPDSTIRLWHLRVA